MPVIHYNYENAFAPENRKARKTRIAQIEANAPHVADSERYLEDLRKDGWNLTDVDLDLVEAHADRVGAAYSPMEFGSAVCTLISETHEAIRGERIRREEARQRHAKAQRDRITSITTAAHDLEHAHKLLDDAEAVGRDPSLIPSYVPATVTSESAADMEPKQLEAIIASESASADRDDNNAGKIEHDAESLETWGGAQGKRLAKELRAHAKAARDGAAACRANVSTARAELDRRAKAKEEAESASSSIAQTTADVQELLRRIEELEAFWVKSDEGGDE